MTRPNAWRATELVAGAGVSALLTIGTIIYVGRTIGPVEYADFSAGLAVIYLVGLALSPVLPTVARVVTKFAAKGDLSPVIAMRRGILRWVLGSSALILALTALFIVPLARWLNFRSPQTLLLAVITALLHVVINVDRGVLQGVFRFREYNVNTVIEAAVRAIVIAVLIHTGPTATFAMLAWALGSLIAQLAILWSLSRMSRSVQNAEVAWDEFVGLLRPMILLMFSIAVFQNSDVFAVKRWLTADQAGVYGAASALTRGFGVLFVPLYVLAGPLLTQLHEERRSIFGATLRFNLGYLALAAIPLIVVTVWPQQIITILYGVPYVGGASVLGPLAGVTIVTYTALMLSQALLTLGETRFLIAYAACALLQVVTLALFHSSFSEVLAALWGVQTSALFIVALFFFRARSRRC